ncbi:Serine-threonine/tyrosine-protein kinase [Theobroma cacao]|nr:Serine-threonine/tyrosine-protein kinase [Theobroma cacao]
MSKGTTIEVDGISVHYSLEPFVVLGFIKSLDRINMDNVVGRWSNWLSAQSPNITTDQLALLALKSHVTFDPQNLLETNWSTATSVCNWIGVTCGAKHLRVTALNLFEYGSEGIISTEGDVYSFGILLMETFTRKKPTDEMFVEETSLKCWVEESLPYAVVHVVDTNLLNNGKSESLAANECVLSILQLALECSMELPEKRIDMKQVVARLKKIKVTFLQEIKHWTSAVVTKFGDDISQHNWYMKLVIGKEPDHEKRQRDLTTLHKYSVHTHDYKYITSFLRNLNEAATQHHNRH